MEPAAAAPPLAPTSTPPPTRGRGNRSADLGYRGLRWAVLALALGSRLYWLDGRPPHFDEGVNGWFTDQMQKAGCYKYDPTNYHGPLHFYVLFLFKTLLGRNLWALRLPTAIIGVLTVEWCFRFERFFGRRAAAWTAVALAVSPAMLYFQRDAIHEAWLVFFLVLGCWGVCGLWQEGGRRHLWATGMALAGMILTKETYAIHVGCLCIAWGCVLAVEAVNPSRRALLPPPRPPPPPEEEEKPARSLWTLPTEPSWLPEGWAGTFAPQRWRTHDLLAVAVVTLALLIFFYSGNGFYPDGLGGMFTAFVHWGHKSQEGEGHNKPFIYWCKLIARNEPWVVPGLLACLRYAVPPLPRRTGAGRLAGGIGLAVCLGILAVQGVFLYDLGPSPQLGQARGWLMGLLPFLQRAEVEWAVGLTALAGAVAGTSLLALPAPGDWRVRLIAIYGVGTLLAYSLIPYKTPWCIISMLWPFFLVAGAAMEELGALAARTGNRAWETAVVAAGAATVVSAGFALDLNFRRPTDDKQDYVYVQSFNDVWTVVNPMLAEAERDPTFYQAPGVILCNSTYPLPWLLGDFTHIGYYADNNKPLLVGDYRADFLLVTEKRIAEAEVNLDEDYYMETVTLRPALERLQLYLRAARFKRWMPADRQPEFHPVPEAPAVPGTAPAPGTEPLPVKVMDDDKDE